MLYLCICVDGQDHLLLKEHALIWIKTRDLCLSGNAQV